MTRVTAGASTDSISSVERFRTSHCLNVGCTAAVNLSFFSWELPSSAGHCGLPAQVRTASCRRHVHGPLPVDVSMYILHRSARPFD